MIHVIKFLIKCLLTILASPFCLGLFILAIIYWDSKYFDAQNKIYDLILEL